MKRGPSCRTTGLSPRQAQRYSTWTSIWRENDGPSSEAEIDRARSPVPFHAERSAPLIVTWGALVSGLIVTVTLSLTDPPGPPTASVNRAVPGELVPRP